MHKTFPSKPIVTLLGILVPSFLVVLLALLPYRSYKELVASTRWVTHTIEVQHHIQALGRELVNAESSQRGFLLTGNRNYLQPYQVALQNIPVESNTLRTLITDNPFQQTNLDQLATAISDRLSEMAQTISLEQQGQRTAALNLVGTDRRQKDADRIRQLLANMDNEEQQLLEQRQERLTHQSRFNAALAMSLVVLTALFCAFIFILLRRLARSQAWVTICAWSKTIEVDGEWLTFEEYLQRRFGFKISHGMSPEGTRGFFTKPPEKKTVQDKGTNGTKPLAN